MYTDSELAETIANLQNSDPAERAATLKALWTWPAQDSRLLPHIRGLLNDTAACVFGSPPQFGEIRWLAAQVIFAEYKAQRRKERICLEDVVKPLKATELVDIAKKAGIACDANRAALLAVFAELQRLGQLPVTKLELRL